MKPNVSIIIPFFNCQYINQAIQSTLNQSYSNIEVIVVNDGSTLYKDRIMPFLKDKRVKYIEKANGGTASALNAGIRISKGNYIVWLSSDDFFVKDKVQKQFLFMQKNNFHISYTNFSRINEKGVVIKERAAIHPVSRKKLCIRLLKGCPINGSTIMIKREVYNKVGKFNEKLACTQDYDYWLRTIQHYNFGYLDEPLTLYRVHNKMGSIKHRTKLLNEANLLKRKHRPLLLRTINRL